MQDTQLALLRTLVAVSDVDLAYSDLYLHRAGELLPGMLGREEYDVVRAERGDLPRLADEVRRATERAQWARVEALAAEAAIKQVHAATTASMLDVADVVYGPRTLRLSPIALALAGLASHPHLERERAELIERLTWLGSADAAWQGFYARRAQAVAAYRCVPGTANPAIVDEQALRALVLDAVGHGDFATVRGLVHGVGDGAGGGEPRHVVSPMPAHANVLRSPIPPLAIARASTLGLVPEVLAGDPQCDSYLAGDPVPGPWPALRDSLDILVSHPFMTSGGTRYVPWFGEETLLVENFPETEPDRPGPLLERLGLARRRGLSRLAVEDAVRSHSVALCTELGLDPFEFVLTTIPFDAYVRLAHRYGWGAQTLWTHFDGYQLTSDFRLRALVGGDVRYGGAGDLCAVQRNYDALRITTRLCIVRRERLVIRSAIR